MVFGIFFLYQPKGLVSLSTWERALPEPFPCRGVLQSAWLTRGYYR